jgi:hypothetical protein
MIWLVAPDEKSTSDLTDFLSGLFAVRRIGGLLSLTRLLKLNEMRPTEGFLCLISIDSDHNLIEMHSGLSSCLRVLKPHEVTIVGNLTEEQIRLAKSFALDTIVEPTDYTEFSRQLKIADGSVESLPVPAELKELYQTAFDIEPEQLIRCASMRQKYIDQAQSLNLYLGKPSGRRLDEMYRYAWHCGLKTTYYLRSKAASGVEKSSVNQNAAAGSEMPGVGGLLDSSTAGAANAASEPKACSIENPDCEACQ